MDVNSQHKAEIERFDFLTNQYDDLVKAEDSLQKTINKLDTEARKMFLDTKIYSTKNVEVKWKEPVKSKTIDLLCGKYEFSKSRVDNALDKFFGPGKGKAEQVTLGDFK